MLAIKIENTHCSYMLKWEKEVNSVRIKEQIRKSGFFWLPFANSNSFDAPPDNAVFGTLSISDGGNIELELTQSLVLDDLNQILGHVETYGRVTIDRCRSITPKSRIVHGVWMEAEIIKANRVFTGIRYKEDVPPRFNTFTFSVEGIDEWVGISGIKVDPQFENSALTISYNRPKDVTLSLENGMQLQIIFAWTPPGFPATKRAEVTQKIYFRLVSQESHELEAFISVAEKIAAFLCFIMDEIVCLEEVTATPDNLHCTGGTRTEPIPVGIYCPTWPYSKDEPEINEMNMLFRLEEIQSQINKWLQNYEQIAPAFDLYFLAKSGTLPTLNLLFLTLVQALEAFHGRTSNEEHTLRIRFERMTEPFANFMCGERRPGLIDKIVKTRNYLTHYNSDLEPQAAKGDVLQFLCRKMNALFRLHFLKLIGFDEQEINAIVDKCPYFKGECNLGS